MKHFDENNDPAKYKAGLVVFLVYLIFLACLIAFAGCTMYIKSKHGEMFITKEVDNGLLQIDQATLEKVETQEKEEK